jgi:membrane protein required for colicin V production
MLQSPALHLALDHQAPSPEILRMQSEPSFFSTLSWIDITAFAILAVFGVMGLFRGLVWQVSRLLSIVLGYIAAIRYAEPVADQLAAWFAIEDRPIAVYIAYVVIFVTVLVVLSVITGLLRKVLQRTGLSFLDRMGGWLFGLLTGAAVIIITLTIVFAFAPRHGEFVREVQASHSARYAGRIVNRFDEHLPEDIRKLFADWPDADAGTVPYQGGPRRIETAPRGEPMDAEGRREHVERR